MNAAFYACDMHAEDKSRVAIFHEDYMGHKGKITFRELKRFSNRLANLLHSRLIRKGDRVAICLSQRPETIISHLAVWKLGAVSMPLTVLFGTDGLKFRLQNSDAKIAVVEDAILGTLHSIQTELPDLEGVIVVGETRLQANEVEFWKSLNQMPSHLDTFILGADDNLFLT